MQKTALQIFEECKEDYGLLDLFGNEKVLITAIAAFEKGGPTTMVFAPTLQALQQALDNQASLIIIPKKLPLAADLSLKNIAILTSSNISVSHARIKQRYADHDYDQSGWVSIHPSAIIHPSVHLPDTITIGPNVVIEQGVRIGNHTRLMANVIIEHHATIGEGVTIHPSTVVGWDCVIGGHCLLLSNSVIGSEGFGYAQDARFQHHRIPQTGKVVIGNRVTIGALNTIDRGTYEATTIGDGCIFDNHCHVAHNVTMGNNCIILSGFLCAGSCTIGNRVVASGGAMIKDHLTICDDVYLMHRAGVVKDITRPGMYAGSPVLPMSDYVKSTAIYADLGGLRQSLKEIQRKIEQLGFAQLARTR